MKQALSMDRKEFDKEQQYLAKDARGRRIMCLKIGGPLEVIRRQKGRVEKNHFWRFTGRGVQESKDF